MEPEQLRLHDCTAACTAGWNTRSVYQLFKPTSRLYRRRSRRERAHFPEIQCTIYRNLQDFYIFFFFFFRATRIFTAQVWREGIAVEDLAQKKHDHRSNPWITEMCRILLKILAWTVSFSKTRVMFSELLPHKKEELS